MILNGTWKRKRRRGKKMVIKQFIDLKAMIQKLCYMSIAKISFEKRQRLVVTEHGLNSVV